MFDHLFLQDRETELLFQLVFDGDDGRRVDVQWQLEMQSRLDVLEILANCSLISKYDELFPE